MPDPTALIAALRIRLPRGTGLGQADPRGAPDGLLPGEVLAQAVPARLREFAAGRVAARKAMAEIGLPALAIPQAPDRAPQWPKGVVGSISHCADLCLAVTGKSADWDGLGVDLELAHNLDASLWSDVLCPDERAWLTTMPVVDQGPTALSMFVAKEAAYKAQYMTSRTLFGFDALGIQLTGQGFAATFRQAVPGFAVGDCLDGVLIREAGYVAALCGIANRQRRTG
jgi:4'-phosphopantetheinyl transferase EntD